MNFRAGSFMAKAVRWVGIASVALSVAACNNGDNNQVVALQSIAVTPTNPSVAKGTTQQFTATAMMSDGSTQDITEQVAWIASDAAVATIGNTAGTKGRASAVGVGSTSILAVLDSISGSTILTVTPASLQSLAVTPSNPSIAKGTSRQFTATGTFSDNSTQDLTTQVIWASSDTSKATISNAAGSNGLASGIAQGAVTILATLSGVQGSTGLTVTAATLQSLAVTPATPSVALGGTQQFTATGTFSDGSIQDLTQQVTWASSVPANATISNAAGSRGLASTVATGTTAISAALGAVSNSTTLTVTAATLQSIAVSPPNPSIALGGTQQFTATGTFSDSSTQNLTASVTWNSSDPTKATISNAAASKGLATSVAVGSTTISAALSGVTGSTVLTVTSATLQSLAVTPANASLAAGFTRQYTATGTFSDASTQNMTAQVTWASTDSGKATISNAPGSKGLATGVAPGATTISAALNGITASTALAVTNATLSSVVVTPANPAIALGSTQQFTATGTFTDASTQDLTTQVTWASSDTSKATISNAAGSQGRATTAAVGPTTISATRGATVGSTTLTVTPAVLTSIAVTPATASLAVGFTRQYTATGTFSDGTTQNLTTQVTWAVSSPARATISNAGGSQGLASGVSAGAVTVTATLSSVSGSAALTVTNATLSSISVTPANPSAALGTTQPFTATGNFSDASTQDLTTQVTWASSDTSKATVSNAAGTQGLASTVATGATTISATRGATAGSTTLTVTPAVLTAIAVTPANAKLAFGYTRQYTATGTFSDATTQDLTTQVTWVSSDPNKATISNASSSQGLALGLSVGTTTISASLTGVTGNTLLAVTNASLSSIAVTPAGASLAIGFTRQYTATGTFSDASTQDLTTQVAWGSSDTSKATINNALGSKGLATGVAAGPTTITATVNGVTGSTGLTVTSATLTGITVTPANQTVHGRNVNQQYTATGTFSDSSTLDVTTQVTWASAETSIATISNVPGSQGLATTTNNSATGPTSISATKGSIGGSGVLIKAIP